MDRPAAKNFHILRSRRPMRKFELSGEDLNVRKNSPA